MNPRNWLTARASYPSGGDPVWQEDSLASQLLRDEFFGAPAAPPAGAELVITPGSYAITGQAARTIWGRRVDTTAAAYALTGSPTELIYTQVAAGLVVDVTPGSYALTGSAATTLWRRRVDVTPAVFTISGQTATLRRTYRADALPGAYTVAGSLVDLDYSGDVPVTVAGEYQILFRRRRR